MRPSNKQRLWSDPVLPMNPAFRRMSYALFRLDGDTGRVVAIRTPEETLLRVGDRIQDRFALDDEALDYIAAYHGNEAPLFVLTTAGIGLLWNRYALSAGLGLYLHIHAKPSSVSRLMNRGVLGDPSEGRFSVSEAVHAYGNRISSRDETSYLALTEAWDAVQEGETSLFLPDNTGYLSLHQLRDGIHALAEFAGCSLRFTLPKGFSQGEGAELLRYARVKCYRPRVLEAILLCLLSEVRERSCNGGGVCRLEPHPRDGERLAFTIHYPKRADETPEDALSGEQYDTLHSYLERVGETCGMDLYASREPVVLRGGTGIPEMMVTLDWMLDPSVLSTSDLKARLALARETENREARSTEMEEEEWTTVFE